MTPWQFLGLCGFSVMVILGAFGSFWAAGPVDKMSRGWIRSQRFWGWIYLVAGIIGLVIGLVGFVVTAIW